MKPTSNQTKSTDEIVILIHGTYAGDPADEGPKWWQKGSNTWLRIERALPGGIRMGDVFHWAEGSNSQRARTEAAHALLKRLLDLEKRQQGYHLIGHSHGGSVIWECLRQAIYERKRSKEITTAKRKLLGLDNLKSWTTVGTPFIEFTSKLLPAQDPSADINDIDSESNYFNFRQRWHRAVIRYEKPFNLSLWAMIGMVFLATISTTVHFVLNEIIGLEYRAPEFMSRGVWFDIPAIAEQSLIFLFLLIVAAYSIRVAEAAQFVVEQKIASLAIKEFGSKWLGIISKDDEAFHAVKVSLDLKLSIIPNREFTTSTFYSDRIFRSFHWLREMLNPIYNLIVPRFGDRFISDQISKSIQGNDRPGSVGISVTSNPCSSDGFSMPLPQEIDAQLVSLANKRAADLIPHFRSLLYSIHGGNLQSNGQLEIDASSGLVHNSYFAIDEVLEIIAHYISTTSDVGPPVCEDNTLITDWVQAFKTNFQRCIDFRGTKELT